MLLKDKFIAKSTFQKLNQFCISYNKKHPLLIPVRIILQKTLRVPSNCTWKKIKIEIKIPKCDNEFTNVSFSLRQYRVNNFQHYPTINVIVKCKK